MDIYDERIYRLNKKLLGIVGLWPYDKKKKIIRSCWLVLVVVLTIPHLIGVAVNYSNVDELMEHVCIILMMVSVFLKLFTLVISEKKILNFFPQIKKHDFAVQHQFVLVCTCGTIIFSWGFYFEFTQMICVYKDMANNWSMIADDNERGILVEYSENGRLLTMAYIGIVVFSVVLFISLPLVPEILNLTNPLPVPRPHIYIFHGEFLMKNKNDHYMKIYACDVMIIMTTIAVGFAGDSMYMVGVEHCSALYSIVKYRLSLLLRAKKIDNSNDLNSHECLVDTVKLHQVAIRFVSNINDSYCLCFLCLAITNIGALPISCVLMITYWGDPVNFFRMALFFACLMLHLFVLFWPGQKIIDHSATLGEDAYCNDWYESSTEIKKMIRFFMLRCTQPPLLTAGGLTVMSVENYFKVVKTAASYVTVLLSFR